MIPNVLNRTRTYLIGNMECGTNNEEWRLTVRKELDPLGIICFDPYDHPFVRQIDEGQQSKLIKLRKDGDLDELEEKMKDIRRYDLSMVDRSDFIIGVVKPDTPTWGTTDELVMMEALNRPIFVHVEGGKRNAPLWLYSLVPHRYMYSSIEEIIDVIKRIDSGEIEPDSKRWRLMRKEYR